MQADFVLFLNSALNISDFRSWWPVTLLYVGHSYRPFEAFARSKSMSYFEKTKKLLGVSTKQELDEKLNKLEKRDLPRWEYESFDPRVLLGFDTLGTKA